MPARKPKQTTCNECGTTITKVVRSDRRQLCLDCAIRATADAIRSMRDKRGPAWDAWQASNASKVPGDRGRPRKE